MARKRSSKGDERGISKTRSSPSIKGKPSPSSKVNKRPIPSEPKLPPNEQKVARAILFLCGVVFLGILLYLVFSLVSSPPQFSLNQIPWSVLISNPVVLLTGFTMVLGVIFILLVLVSKDVDGVVQWLTSKFDSISGWVFQGDSQQAKRAKSRPKNPQSRYQNPKEEISFYIYLIGAGLLFLVICLLLGLSVLPRIPTYQIQMPAILNSTNATPTPTSPLQTPAPDSPLETPSP